MKALKATRILSCAFGVLLLAGFTGQYVELEGMLNGRSSATFGRNDNNIQSVLPRGTRGEILKTKTFNSGNHGLKIRVLEGPRAGEVYWVYHKRQNSHIALYSEVPSNWTTRPPRPTGELNQAKSAETLRDVTSVPDTPAEFDLSEMTTQATAQAVSAPAESAEVRPAPGLSENEGRPQIRPRDMTRIIQRANQQLANTQSCTNCSTRTTGVGRNPLARGSKALNSRCNILMNANGEMGSLGQHMYSTMARSPYARQFTKSNALGRLCPKFDSFSTEQKLHAWVFMWTALAHEESGCNANVVHPTHAGGRRINPTVGVGLWAAERSASLRRPRTGCSDISGGQGQANCAIGTMYQTALNRGYSATSRRDGYWGPLRRSNSQMMPHMRRYKACF